MEIPSKLEWEPQLCAPAEGTKSNLSPKSPHLTLEREGTNPHLPVLLILWMLKSIVTLAKSVGMAQDRLLPCGSLGGTLSPDWAPLMEQEGEEGALPDTRDNGLLQGNIKQLRECKSSISKPCSRVWKAAWKGVCTPGLVPALLPWQPAEGWSCCHRSPLHFLLPPQSHLSWNQN